MAHAWHGCMPCMFDANCFAAGTLNQGSCDSSSGRCACSPGYRGPDCSSRYRPYEILSDRLAAPDQRDIVSRAGHSLIVDYHSVVWIFGGLHPDRGLLQDVRYSNLQCCGSKYIDFGSGSRAKFGSGSGFRVMLSILKKKKKTTNFREKLFSLKNILFTF